MTHTKHLSKHLHTLTFSEQSPTRVSRRGNKYLPYNFVESELNSIHHSIYFNGQTYCYYFTVHVHSSLFVQTETVTPFFGKQFVPVKCFNSCVFVLTVELIDRSNAMRSLNVVISIVNGFYQYCGWAIWTISTAPSQYYPHTHTQSDTLNSAKYDRKSVRVCSAQVFQSSVLIRFP